MPLTVTVNTTAEFLRTDCNILGDKKRKLNLRSRITSSAYRSSYNQAYIRKYCKINMVQLNYKFTIVQLAKYQKPSWRTWQRMVSCNYTDINIYIYS